MSKPKLVRIDPDVMPIIKELAKEHDRSIPKQINRMLREQINNGTPIQEFGDIWKDAK